MAVMSAVRASTSRSNCHPASRERDASSASCVTSLSPVGFYREFLDCVKRQQIDQVIAKLSLKNQRQFRALSRESDFGPFFAMWCESFPAVEAVFCEEQSPRAATLNVRYTEGVRTYSAVVQLVMENGDWRVDSESHTVVKPA